MLTLAAARRHTWCVVNFLRTLTSAALVRDCSDELNVVTAAPRGKGYITVIRSPRTRFLTHRHSLCGTTVTVNKRTMATEKNKHLE